MYKVNVIFVKMTLKKEKMNFARKMQKNAK